VYLLRLNSLYKPPHALETFISNQPGVVETSNGDCIIFYAPTLGILLAIPGQVKAQTQFRRIGPTMANLLAVGVQQPLVEFYTLSTMQSPLKRTRILSKPLDEVIKI
jgi:hypothetical protein